jgi:hypothetical protein
MLGADIDDDLCRVETVNGNGSPAESPTSLARIVNVVQKRSLNPSFCMAFVFGISTHGLPLVLQGGTASPERGGWPLLVEMGSRVTFRGCRLPLGTGRSGMRHR